METTKKKNKLQLVRNKEKRKRKKTVRKKQSNSGDASCEMVPCAPGPESLDLVSCLSLPIFLKHNKYPTSASKAM